jgi:TorA maturation chaperone TorD
MARTALSTASDVSSEDVLRANLYRMLAHVLRAPPQRTDLELFASMGGDGTPLGRAMGSLAHLARRMSPEAADREYHVLFIGIDGGELLPYGSHYRSGLAQTDPLAHLQGDMERLGIVRSAETQHDEDHIAALCEMMAGLILGHFGEPAPIEEQRAFFRSHIGSWAGRFFADLQGARASILYAAVGNVGAVFMKIEEAAFDMA